MCVVISRMAVILGATRFRGNMVGLGELSFIYSHQSYGTGVFSIPNIAVLYLVPVLLLNKGWY